MTDSQTLCMRLLKAESESEVQKIIEETPKMSSADNWFPLDGRETNFNIVTNQATTGGKAATELMTNMVDAILMKEADEKNIDPTGSEAPQTMYEAVDTLITNIRGGKLVKAEENWLREFADKNLIIGVTGAKGTVNDAGNPCFTFADNGEGQNPDKFEDTFLSLSAGHKKEIPFVQGKFNMGSSGVLGFCGNHWFKLIISRRYDKSGHWGWTLMRKRPREGTPIVEYFKIENQIPHFDTNSISPLHTQKGEVFDDFNLETGTIVKLYNFRLGSGHSGFRGSREAFNENLVETILPFRIYDFRQTPDQKRGGLRAKGIDVRPFYGMEYLLLQSHKDEQDVENNTDSGPVGESKLTVQNISDPKLGKISITAIPLKKDIPGWLKASISRVFHTVNGQVQFKQTRGFLTQCKYPALKDRVVIIVDSSGLNFSAHNDVWKGDREHIRETETGEDYKLLIQEALQKSEVLKDLHNEIARKELDQATQKESSDVFQKLVDNDENLADLLNNRDPSLYVVTNKDDVKYEGKYSPTFFELDRKSPEEIEIPINRNYPIVTKTDVVNEYFHRADNQGDIDIANEEVEKHFRIYKSLKNGKLIVTFKPDLTTGLSVGDKFSFELGLCDPAMPEPKTIALKFVIVKAKDKPPGPPKPPKPKPKPQKDLPPYKLLTKDGRKVLDDQETEKWPENFTTSDGGFVKDLGEEGRLYKINYDNIYHLNALQATRGDVEKSALTQKYVLGMRLLMLGFEHALSKQEGDSDANNLKEHEDTFRKIVARGAATVVLSLAETLPKIIGAEDDEVE